MKKIKIIGLMFIVLCALFIPSNIAFAAQPPLYVDFTNTYHGTTKSIKIDNGIHLMDGGDFFREVKIDVKYLPENAEVYFGGEFVSNEVQYMSDIPSENNSEYIYTVSYTHLITSL